MRISLRPRELLFFCVSLVHVRYVALFFVISATHFSLFDLFFNEHVYKMSITSYVFLASSETRQYQFSEEKIQL